MEYIAGYIPDMAGTYYYLFAAACVFGVLYIHDMLIKAQPFSGSQKKLFNYGYESHNGPALWKTHFVQAGGQKQSPVNLSTSCSINVPSEILPLQFSEEFHVPPYEMKLYNNGINAVLYAKWCGDKRPTICGGPLEDLYKFLHVKFRWGSSDEDGSEHMVDMKRFAVEMQAFFVKDSMPQCDLLDAADNGGLLVLSYFFMITPIDNPYIEPLVQALRYTKFPLSCAMISPFPLKLLTPSFSRNYFYYDGSLTFPPCTEEVRWIVQSEPLAISGRQVRKFRKLLGCNYVPLASNSRPVQLVNEREIFYYD